MFGLRLPIGDENDAREAVACMFRRRALFRAAGGEDKRRRDDCENSQIHSPVNGLQFALRRAASNAAKCESSFIKVRNNSTPCLLGEMTTGSAPAWIAAPFATSTKSTSPFTSRSSSTKKLFVRESNADTDQYVPFGTTAFTRSGPRV